MFSKILIANRGEIALRVARTCRELGIRTVLVYSTADEDSLAARMCDERVRIGPAAAKRSYLNIPAIIEAAVRTGADAVHPGYGFLSEDPDFAEICADNGIMLIGPPPDVLVRLGDKALSRQVLADAGLPVLPGSHGVVRTLAAAEKAAADIGYPVIIKAAAGGGGRGMAVVREPAEFPRLYDETRAHAQAVFADGRIYLERFLERARHVEVQLLADQHGNVVHLGERDCSVQRRHQKLIEESPAPRLPAGTAVRVAEAAVRGAQAVGYQGAGTFEFLVDADGAFSFMEANCRIQVEHPVTEMVTGIDIVAEQIAVAAGRPLSFSQSAVSVRGAAIECRINAEDPERDFAPAPGLLTELILPGGPFTRVDTHAHSGLRVAAEYDSLLAKLVVWGPDRACAIRRADRALSEIRASGPGIRTTAQFLRRVLNDPAFVAAEHTTSLIGQLTTTARQGDAPCRSC